MPQLSRQLLKSEIKTRIVELLPQCVSLCKSQSIAASFINDLLTPTEILMIGKRVAIALMLIKKRTPREISEKLRVSLTTVNNVNTWLLIKGEGYRAILQEVARLDEQKEIEYERSETKIIKSTPRYGTSWKAVKKEQYQELKKATPSPF